jgi:hypothetical protein
MDPSVAAASVGPRPFVVDVNETYTSEPAPMGIADYGVAANGTGYSYTTSAFRGTASIQGLAAHFRIGHKHVFTGTGITLQLNAELVLSHPDKPNITYWIQDVPLINTSNNAISLEDNVWNWSGSGALPAGTIVGNGSIDQGTVYIDTAGPGYAGNGVLLTYPTNISAEVVASDIGGIPYVGFEYNDGYGWVTYDNVSFPWAQNWTSDGFLVDGFSYAPNGVFYDAEWVEGGPGGGLSDIQDSANFTMGLDYWNGHNFQAVENAFNHGGDTGESMSNVTPAYTTSSDGGPVAHEAAGANGVLGMLYDRAQVAVLNVTSVYPRSNLTIGPDLYPVLGGEVNVTLAPGTYSLTLSNGSGGVNQRTVTLVGGEYLAITMGHIAIPSPVWFNETGLPAGTAWSVTINNRTFTSTNASLQLLRFNGSYDYVVGGIAGYHLTGSAYNASFVVSGPLAITLAWGRVLYTVTATADGLAAGVAWSISVHNSTYRSTTGTITFQLPNGTYSYDVEVAYRFIATDPADILEVVGQSVSVYVPFAPRYATLTGTATPAAATLYVNGTEAESGQATFSVSALPGTYEVTAELAGYHTFYDNITLTPGNSTVLTIRLSEIPVVTPHHNSSNASTSGGGWTAADTLVGAAVVAVVLAAAIAVLWVRRGRQP